MRSFIGLFFLVDFGGFFHFGKASAKNISDVHAFKPFFFRLCHGILRLFKS